MVQRGIGFDWNSLAEQRKHLGLDSKGLEDGLVDTAFFESIGLPVREVGDGLVNQEFIQSLEELERDLAYLAVAYKYAELFSRDPSTQNGAILVSPTGEILIGEANRFPPGIEETHERWHGKEKYGLVVHAEDGTTHSAGRLGIATEGLTMYCPWFACDNCGKAIITSRLKRVVGHNKPMDFYAANNPQKAEGWKASIDVALNAIAEVGIPYEFLEGDINNGTQIRMGGKIMIP
jgi:dCMP deaminase